MAPSINLLGAVLHVLAARPPHHRAHRPGFPAEEAGGRHLRLALLQALVLRGGVPGVVGEPGIQRRAPQQDPHPEQQPRSQTQN